MNDTRMRWVYGSLLIVVLYNMGFFIPFIPTNHNHIKPLHSIMTLQIVLALLSNSTCTTLGHLFLAYMLLLSAFVGDIKVGPTPFYILPHYGLHALLFTVQIVCVFLDRESCWAHPFLSIVEPHSRRRRNRNVLHTVEPNAFQLILLGIPTPTPSDEAEHRDTTCSICCQPCTYSTAIRVEPPSSSPLVPPSVIPASDPLPFPTPKVSHPSTDSPAANPRFTTSHTTHVYTAPTSTTDRVTWPHCHHTFHQACILQWIREKQSQATCPVCRRALVRVNPTGNELSQNEPPRDEHPDV